MAAEERASGAVWSGHEYARESDHHRSVDAWFLDRLRPQPADVVVDAGCGSGEFTARLAEHVPDGRVIGVEPDPSMLEAAQGHAHDRLEFRQGRLQDLDRVCAPASADLVVSRAVFHWIPLEDYPACYAAVHRVLKPGGMFHAESGGAGNVARIAAFMDEIAARHGLTPAGITFPDAATALELVEEAGFAVPEGGVTTVAQRRTFDRDQLAGFVRTQAAVAYGAPPSGTEGFLAEVLDRLDDLRRPDGSYDQTFVRLDVLCQRPDG